MKMTFLNSHMMTTAKKHDVRSGIIHRIAIYVMNIGTLLSALFARLFPIHSHGSVSPSLFGHVVSLPRRAISAFWLLSATRFTVKSPPSNIGFPAVITASSIFHIFTLGIRNIPSDP